MWTTIKDWLVAFYGNNKNKVLLAAGAAGVYYAGSQHLVSTVFKALVGLAK
mgnify:CR=1 FL=1